jgi:hypothetical protein
MAVCAKAVAFGATSQATKHQPRRRRDDESEIPLQRQAKFMTVLFMNYQNRQDKPAA